MNTTITPSQVFVDGELLEVRIKIKPSDWQNLLSEGRSFEDLIDQDKKTFKYNEYSADITLNGKNFENIDLSDWERNGLRSESANSNEGRVELPLADQTFSQATHGINFGILVGITEKAGVLAEWQYSGSTNLEVSSWMLGGSYDLVIHNGLCLAAVSKIGLSKVSANIGSINWISGYGNPVLSEGTVYGGDYLAAELRKLAYQVGFRGDIALRGDGVRLNLQLGIGGTTIGSKRFLVNSPDGGTPMKLNFKDDSVVAPDGSSEQAGVRPSLKSMGVYFTIGYSGFGGRKRKFIY